MDGSGSSSYTYLRTAPYHFVIIYYSTFNRVGNNRIVLPIELSRLSNIEYRWHAAIRLPQIVIPCRVVRVTWAGCLYWMWYVGFARASFVLCYGNYEAREIFGGNTLLSQACLKMSKHMQRMGDTVCKSKINENFQTDSISSLTTLLLV